MDLTVETFVRIESGILMSIVFTGWRSSYTKFYRRWEKVCCPWASYQHLPVPYSQWHEHCNLLCNLHWCNLHCCNSCPCFYALVGEIKLIIIIIVNVTVGCKNCCIISKMNETYLIWGSIHDIEIHKKKYSAQHLALWNTQCVMFDITGTLTQIRLKPALHDTSDSIMQ